MFGFGHGPELIIILVIALIVLGPGKIPEVAQMLGKGIRELRQASADLQKTFDVNELMNPTPPTPPPAEPAINPVPVETILPPAVEEAPAKPKRTRKRPAIVAEDAVAAAVAEPVEAEAAPRPRPRRRPSKKTTEPVSIDASA